MEERDFRWEMERIEIARRTELNIADHFVKDARKKLDTVITEALIETRELIDKSILERYSVEKKILKDRKERERRRR